jgi:hypothetical protein
MKSNSNVSGWYGFTLNDGTYNLSVTPPQGSGYSPSAVNGIAVSGANVNQNIVLLPQSVTFSGVVGGPDGTPASNIKIIVLNSATYTEVASMMTGQGGAFSFSNASGFYSFPTLASNPLNSLSDLNLVVYPPSGLGLGTKYLVLR